MLSRVKTDIHVLVSNMMDCLPEIVWEDPTTTFLDKSMGGGQFVSEIENRLRAHGHDDQNIHGRVFGFEANKMRKQFAINSKKLVGTYWSDNYESQEPKMKINVVVGNPPFSSPNKDDNEDRAGGSGNGSVYDEHIKNCLLLDPDYAVFVTPAAWTTSPGFQKYRDALTEYGLVHVSLVGQPFPGVRVPSDVCYIYLDKNHSGKTNIVDSMTGVEFDIDLENVGFIPRHNPDIVMKLAKHVSIETVIGRGKLSTVPNKIKPNYVMPKELSWTETAKHPYPMLSRLRPSQDKREIVYVEKESIDANDIRVVFHELTEVGKIGQCMIADVGMSTSSKLFYIPATCQTDAENLVQYLNSKVVQFVIKSVKVTINNSKGIFKYVPKIDFTRSWTDEELYEHFGLTEDEIKDIEDTVK